jgi:release factor glutamine methyltransferase
MFVIKNTAEAVKMYFLERLNSFYSEREISTFYKESLRQRLKLSDSEILLQKEIRLSESDLLYFRSVVKRLQNHEPFQYILGETFFYDLIIKCDERALIPRPETEELVSWIINTVDPAQKLQILDICTGSGCIALALKSVLKSSNVFATDISLEAIALAKKNGMLLGLDVNFLQENALVNDSDFFEANSLDIIVSNPPYIPMKENVAMEKNVLDFEPSLALFVSDESPLVFYKAITEKANGILKSNGLLFFELHENHAIETKRLVELLGFDEVEIKLDLQGKNRMLKAKKK